MLQVNMLAEVFDKISPAWLALNNKTHVQQSCTCSPFEEVQHCTSIFFERAELLSALQIKNLGEMKNGHF